ncbi:MAG: hypothetical protein ABI321_04440 [Polyangia bacterium]
MKRVLAALALAGCAHAPVVRPVDRLELPVVSVETPSAGSIQHAAELEVRGTLHTGDGRGWVWVDGTQAEVHDGTWVAHRVPLHEGSIELGVVLTDSAGTKVRVNVPLVVETHDRPFSDHLCVGETCLRYETRGVPVRDAAGIITNAVVVVSAYGFGEKLDALWPELVGPGRALDSRTRYVIGVASDAGVPVETLMASLALAKTTPLVGASTYGAEAVLRLVARSPAWVGPVVICGGHDRPWDEPLVRAVRQALDGPDAWRRVVSLMVPASYTPHYLADVRHASEHGLVDEARVQGLEKALIERQLARPASIAALRERLDRAQALSKAPLLFSGLAGRRVTLVVNTQDRLVALLRVRALGDRLRAAGATVKFVPFDDELGHSAYFRHAPPALEQALIELVKP